MGTQVTYATGYYKRTGLILSKQDRPVWTSSMERKKRLGTVLVLEFKFPFRSTNYSNETPYFPSSLTTYTIGRVHIKVKIVS